jgi:hypothetical protein
VQHWAGLRPMTPSSRPLIGRTRVGNLFVNTGHGRSADPGGRIGATPCRDDRRGSQRGAMRRAGDVDDGCLGCFGCFGFPPIPVVRAMIKLGPAVRPTMGQPFSIPMHPPENCERQTPTQVGRPAARVRSSKADISASDVPPAVMGSKAIGRYVRKIGAIFKEFQ